MSYILQALKKSEQERELAEIGSEAVTANENVALNKNNEHGAKSGVGIFYLAGLCVAAVFIVAWVVVKGAYPQSMNGQKKAVAANLVQFEKTESKEAQSKAIQAKAIQIEKEKNEDVSLEKSVLAEPILLENTPQVIRPKMAVEQASKSVQSLIPNIEISSHIYSSLPMRRSIVVNGERLVETDFIAPQVQVKEITQQGMIIDVDGWSLMVSRSRGWSR